MCIYLSSVYSVFPHQQNSFPTHRKSLGSPMSDLVSFFPLGRLGRPCLEKLLKGSLPSVMGLTGGFPMTVACPPSSLLFFMAGGRGEGRERWYIHSPAVLPCTLHTAPLSQGSIQGLSSGQAWARHTLVRSMLSFVQSIILKMKNLAHVIRNSSFLNSMTG